MDWKFACRSFSFKFIENVLMLSLLKNFWEIESNGSEFEGLSNNLSLLFIQRSKISTIKGNIYFRWFICYLLVNFIGRFNTWQSVKLSKYFSNHHDKNHSSVSSKLNKVEQADYVYHIVTLLFLPSSFWYKKKVKKRENYKNVYEFFMNFIIVLLFAAYFCCFLSFRLC